MAPLGEFEVIARFFAPLAAGMPGAFELLDDAAVVDVPAGRQVVVTTDTLVEGVHFPAGEAAALVGERALAVNVSDLAAMAALPCVYTLALALPSGWDAVRREMWLSELSRGLTEAQSNFGIALIGGDTVATPGPLALTVTALGTVEAGRCLRRSTAAVGDDVWVTGTIGDAALGLAVVRGELAAASPVHRAALEARFRRPQPRLNVGRALAGLASAAADVSDGLVADLGHICATSGLSVTLSVDRLPLSPAARAVVGADARLWPRILAGGDDYELVFTALPAAAPRIERLSADVGVPITRIARTEAAAATCAGPITVIVGDGRLIKLDGSGFRHF